MKPRNNFHNKSHNKNKQGEQRDGGYWIYGKHAVTAALNNDRRKIIRLVASANSFNEIINEAETAGVKLEKIDGKDIDALFPAGTTHQGIACKVRPLADSTLEDILKSKIVLLLDQVSDPHNVGAILRSAAAFGAGAVIMPVDNSPQENGTIAKSASGALEIVPMVKVKNLSAAIDKLKENNFWIIGLDGDSKTLISKMPTYEKIALVMGAEGKGLRRLTAEKCDLLVKLPISDAVESLNVSNAAAIALYEIATK